MHTRPGAPCGDYGPVTLACTPTRSWPEHALKIRTGLYCEVMFHRRSTWRSAREASRAASSAIARRSASLAFCSAASSWPRSSCHDQGTSQSGRAASRPGSGPVCRSRLQLLQRCRRRRGCGACALCLCACDHASPSQGGQQDMPSQPPKPWQGQWRARCSQQHAIQEAHGGASLPQKPSSAKG